MKTTIARLVFALFGMAFSIWMCLYLYQMQSKDKKNPCLKGHYERHIDDDGDEMDIFICDCRQIKEPIK